MPCLKFEPTNRWMFVALSKSPKARSTEHSVDFRFEIFDFRFIFKMNLEALISSPIWRLARQPCGACIRERCQKTIIVRVRAVAIARCRRVSCCDGALYPCSLFLRTFRVNFSQHSPDNENSRTFVKRARQTLLSMFWTQQFDLGAGGHHRNFFCGCFQHYL